MAAIDRSSTNLSVIAEGSFFILEKKGREGLGIVGRRAAPLKMIMKRITPKTVPCGEEPGRDRKEDRTPSI